MCLPEKEVAPSGSTCFMMSDP